MDKSKGLFRQFIESTYDRFFNVETKLDKILSELKNLRKDDKVIMRNLEELRAQVSETTTAEKAALTLIQGLVARLDSAAGDEEAVRAIIADLKASEDQLAAAVVENTKPETAANPVEPVSPVPPFGSA